MKRFAYAALVLAMLALIPLTATASAGVRSGCATSRDRTAPYKPKNLTARAAQHSRTGTSIAFSWKATKDKPSKCLQGYRIYKNGDFVASTNKIKRTFTALTKGRRYTFSVVAFDRARNRSRKSSIVYAPQPAPAPAPAPSEVVGFGSTCGPGNWPDATRVPFSQGALKPFARPIPSNAPLLTSSAGYSSAQMVSWLNARGPADKATINTGGSWDYSHPYYCATSSDPLFSMKSTRYGSLNDGTQLRIPAVAQARSAAAAGGDGHISIIQPDGSVVGAWQYTGVSGSTAVASAWAKEDSIDTGDGVDNFGSTAAYFNNMAGEVRLQELQAGVINHALFIMTNCTWGNAVYPARPGTTAVKCPSAQAAPPLGSHLQLDPNYVLPSGLPAWKYPILRALQTYGAYIGDTGAYSRSISFGIQIESGQQYLSSGEGDKLGQWATANKAQGDITSGINGTPYYQLDFARGIDWSKLRIVSPCAADGSC